MQDLMDYIIQLWDPAAPGAQLAIICTIGLFIVGLLISVVSYGVKQLTHQGTPADAILWFQKQLDESKLTASQKDEQMSQLKQTILKLEILAQGQSFWATKSAQTLQKLSLATGAVEPELTANLKSIVADYENQRVQDEQNRIQNARTAAQLYRGLGALAFATNNP
jgi:hypothetical protein